MKYYNKEKILLAGLFYQLNWLLWPYETRNYRGVKSIGRKKLIKIRSEICTFVIEHSKVLTEETRRSLSDESDLEDLINFLKEIKTDHEECMEQKYAETMELLSDFGEKESNALSLFLDTVASGEDSRIRMYEKSCIIVIEETEAYISSIVLENADGDNIEDGIQWDHAELSRSGDGYLLELLCSDYVNDEDILGKISFSGVSLKVELFNYTLSSISRGNSVPWDMLGQWLDELRSKENLGPEYINNGEKRFLSFCGSELFMPSIFITGELVVSENTVLKDYIKKSNTLSLLPILDSIKRSETKKKRLKQILKFKNEIIKCQYEPLWRCIFEDLKEAASVYPSKSELTSDNVLLTDSRQYVTKRFTDAGFEGEYPHFRKMGSLGKLRIVEANGNPCFVGYEKHMASYVDCMEYCYDGNFTIYFLVGTILFKRDKLESFGKSDAFSGFFYDNARRAGKVLWAFIPSALPGSEAEFDDLNVTISTAIKRSMFEKLSRDERKRLYNDAERVSISTLSAIWTLGGLIYGFMLTLTFMIFDLIVGLIESSGSFIEAWAFMIQTPWWIVFAGSSFGFGALMFIISLISQRK